MAEKSTEYIEKIEVQTIKFKEILARFVKLYAVLDYRSDCLKDSIKQNFSNAALLESQVADLEHLNNEWDRCRDAWKAEIKELVELRESYLEKYPGGTLFDD